MVRGKVQAPRKTFPCARCGGEYVIPCYDGRVFRFAAGHQYAGRIRVECLGCKRALGVVDTIAASMKPFPLPYDRDLAKLLQLQERNGDVSLIALSA